ncbi:MAG: arylsulfatase [Bacteroidota bacterium]
MRKIYWKHIISSFLVFGGAVLAAFPQTQAVSTPERPNVILIITDDQGYGDMSCHGNPLLETPEIDKLHSQSIRFTNFHVDPTCAPTRAGLLTGRYSSRVGVWHTLQGRSIMNKDEITLAQVFGENNYHTALIGKWHLGDNYPYRPQDRGYQEVISFGGGGIGQNPDYWRNDYFSDIFSHNGIPEFFEGYCTDTWFNEAIKYIDQQKDSSAPFFCQIATNAPHFWYYVPEKYAQPFREQGMEDHLARYLGMMVNLDENIGKLMTKLEEWAIAENTLLIFMTDNGKSSYKLPKKGLHYYNAGMRGVKGSQYEGGHRVPLFIKWPEGGLSGGKDIQTLSAQIDIMPTLIELCGLENKYTIKFDGKSLVPLLKSENPGWEERTLFVHNQRVETPVKWKTSVVMNDRYRLINGKELYDILEDPGQKKDIGSSHPEIVKVLTGEYELWWQDISESFDEYSRLLIGDEHENPIKLTCHDWHNEKPLTVWNQDIIRDRKHENGFWTVEFVQDGEYQFTCRTYPLEEDTRMNVTKVRLKIGGKEVEKDCYAGASEVSFTLTLKKGETEIESWFYEEDGNSFGVPFLYVERLVTP